MPSLCVRGRPATRHSGLTCPDLATRSKPPTNLNRQNQPESRPQAQKGVYVFPAGTQKGRRHDGACLVCAGLAEGGKLAPPGPVRWQAGVGRQERMAGAASACPPCFTPAWTDAPPQNRRPRRHAGGYRAMPARQPCQSLEARLLKADGPSLKLWSITPSSPCRAPLAEAVLSLPFMA